MIRTAVGATMTLIGVVAGCAARSASVENRTADAMDVRLYWPGESNFLGHVGMGPGFTVMRLESGQKSTATSRTLTGTTRGTMYGQWKVAAQTLGPSPKFSTWELDYQLSRRVDILLETRDGELAIIATGEKGHVPTRGFSAASGHLPSNAPK